MNREFHLSPSGKGRGVSCGADGAFVGAIPVLERLRKDGKDAWRARDCDELSEEVGEHYGLPIDMSSKRGGLKAIASALNDGDVARAQIATVLLGIPDPPPLCKGARSRDQMIKLIRDLHWSGMIKADWDPDEHPRRPARSSGGRGGEFAPKGQGGGTGVSPTLHSNAAHRTNSNDRKPDAAGRNAHIQLADATASDAADDPVAEAARAAASAQRNAGTTHPQAKPVERNNENIWQVFDSLSHGAKSALAQIRHAVLVNNDADRDVDIAEANDVAHVVRAYANYRAQLWLDSDGRPVQVQAYYTGNAVADLGSLMAHLQSQPNAPLTRPATNADWIDPLINLAALSTMGAGRVAGAGARVLGDIAAPALESDILIGNSGFRGFSEFADAVTTKYQALYDQGYAKTMEKVNQGLLPNDPLVIGNRTDLFARGGLRDWLTNAEGINEGPGQIIRVNRRLYDPLGSGDYRVPDVHVPGSQTILDGSLQFKNSTMPQIADYKAFSGGARIIIVRPSGAASDIVAGSYGIVH